MPEWMREHVAAGRAIEGGDDEHYVALPTQYDIHEYEIMEVFCESYSDRRLSGRLCDAIHGRGAFRRFKDLVNEAGIADEWYRFRDQALGEIAMQWCEENDIACEDDRVPQAEAVSKRDSLDSRVDALLADQTDAIANAANLAAEVFHGVDRINWCGFYFLKKGELVLGPFQGRPACTTIALDRGVCGAAATRRETLVVPDVRKFPGHIACDAASRSEIVVPILQGERLIGVFDVDSPELGRFDETDRGLFERLVEIYGARSDLDGLGSP
jgi:GAF domain-containing protein